MMIDIETRKKVYLQISNKQKYLYENPTSGGMLFSIAQKYDLHKNETYRTFAVTVGDIILGFYRIEDTVPLLQQELGLNPRTAALLGADVLDFLAPLSDPNWQPPVEDREEWDNGEPERLPEVPHSASSHPNGATPSGEALIEERAVPPPVAPPIYNYEPHEIPYPNSAYTAPPNDSKTPLPTPPEHSPYSTQTYSAVPPAYQPVTATPAPSTTPPFATPAVPPQHAPLHTMARDMISTREGVGMSHPTTRPVTPSLNLDHEPLYRGSSQDTLRQPLSSVPSYTPPPQPVTPVTPPNPDPPRWSTTP